MTKGVGKYETGERRPEKRRPKQGKGMAFYSGVSRSWCYICRSEHRWKEPCSAA